MATLLIESGKLQGKQLIFPESENEIVIGRAEGCAMRLTYEEVGPRHCALRVTPHGIVVRDLNSGQGTFVNGTPIAEAVTLRPGDRLRIGTAEFRVPGLREAERGLDVAINDWLAKGDEKSPPPEAETPRLGTQATVASLPKRVPPPKSPVREFRSVAEEAQEIIRRHFETLEEPDAAASR
jgi:pSer/pThr/pTyr-binding forkhead associated (FHA) protein